MIAVLRASVTRLYRAHLSPDTRRKGWRDEHHALLKAVERAPGRQGGGRI